jgi:hypothetical protein
LVGEEAWSGGGRMSVAGMLLDELLITILQALFDIGNGEVHAVIIGINRLCREFSGNEPPWSPHDAAKSAAWMPGRYPTR